MVVMPGRVACCIRSDGTLNIDQCQARNQRLQSMDECRLGSIYSDGAGVVLGTAGAVRRCTADRASVAGP
jgi:hypothetical protein